eukprot:3410647-Rhodomonas_salina.2
MAADHMLAHESHFKSFITVGRRGTRSFKSRENHLFEWCGKRWAVLSETLLGARHIVTRSGKQTSGEASSRSLRSRARFAATSSSSGTSCLCLIYPSPGRLAPSQTRASSAQPGCHTPYVGVDVGCDDWD